MLEVAVCEAREVDVDVASVGVSVSKTNVARVDVSTNDIVSLVVTSVEIGLMLFDALSVVETGDEAKSAVAGFDIENGGTLFVTVIRDDS